MTTLEAIYENGIFRPTTSVPESLREHDRVRITIESNTDTDLISEFRSWEAASDEDYLNIEKSFGESH